MCKLTKQILFQGSVSFAYAWTFSADVVENARILKSTFFFKLRCTCKSPGVTLKI